jgi:Xaa-Pro aminopeptidase
MTNMPKAQSTAGELIYSSSESCADLYYATRFFAPDPMLFLVHRGKKILVLSDLEIDRARRQASVDEILSLTKLEKQLNDRINGSPSLAQLVQFLLEKLKVHSVLIPFDFPAGLALDLVQRGIHLQVKMPPFFEQRSVKDPAEIRNIIRALRAAESGMDTAVRILSASMIGPKRILHWNDKVLTSEILKREINASALKWECTTTHTIVACGKHCCDPHNEGEGRLYANRPIIIDIFPRSQRSGYWGDLTRTFVKGKPSTAVNNLYRAVAKAQKKATGMLRPGVTGKEIHQAILECFESDGYKTGLIHGRQQGFFHGTGHGVGLEIHELPRISPKGYSPLQEGEVVTIEPGLYYERLGGVRLEDMLLITPRGCRNLTHFPKFFVIS